MRPENNLPLSYLDTQLRRDLWEHYAWREFKNGDAPNCASTYTHFNGYTMVYDDVGHCWLVEGTLTFKSLEHLFIEIIPSE